MSDLGLTPLVGWVAVVLAAGRGTRMRSNLPKPLHTVAGVPMVDLVCDAVRSAGIADLVVVTASAEDEVARDVLSQREGGVPGARIAVQAEPLGTGDAALAARESAGAAPMVLIVNADSPLLTPETLRGLLEAHARIQHPSATLTFLTAHVDEPRGYGRVVRGADGGVRGIIEERDADAAARAVGEVNAGVYAVDAAWLWTALEALETGPQGERYLTDIVARALKDGRRVETCALEGAHVAEVQQVNTRVDLAKAEALLRERIRQRLMLEGVTLLDPASTYIDATVEVAADTTLLPGVHLLGATRIGPGCKIGPNAVLRDMIVGEGCEIGGSTLEGSSVGDRVTIGPYCHVRPGSTIESEVHLGNYAEVKASRIGARSAVGHFSYIGDADIGADVNIGAGTVTVNYDGVDKHRTVVGDGAFIGSDSLLVAPIEVGARARTAAGSVVTRDVAANTLVVGVPARPRTTGAQDSADGKEAGGPAGA